MTYSRYAAEVDPAHALDADAGPAINAALALAASKSQGDGYCLLPPGSSVDGTYHVSTPIVIQGATLVGSRDAGRVIYTGSGDAVTVGSEPYDGTIRRGGVIDLCLYGSGNPPGTQGILIQGAYVLNIERNMIYNFPGAGLVMHDRVWVGNILGNRIGNCGKGLWMYMSHNTSGYGINALNLVGNSVIHNTVGIQVGQDTPTNFTNLGLGLVFGQTTVESNQIGMLITEGFFITGHDMYFEANPVSVRIGTSASQVRDVSLRRCNFSGSNPIIDAVGIDHLTVEECYFGYYTWSTPTTGVQVGANVSQYLIANNTVESITKEIEPYPVPTALATPSGWNGPTVYDVWRNNRVENV